MASDGKAPNGRVPDDSPAGAPPRGDSNGAASTPDRGPSLRRAMEVFQHRNYTLLWASAGFSFVGMQMHQVVRGLLAWELTESFAAVGWVSFSYGLPMILFALFGGAIADRAEKRNLTLLAQGSTALAALATAVLITTGLINIELLFVIGLLQGTFFVLGAPARMPMMAEIVDGHQIVSAIAMSNAVMNATRIVGPALAAVIIAPWGLGVAYYVLTSFYIASTLTVLMVPTGLSKRPRNRAPKSQVLREIRNGVRYAATDSRLRLLLLMAFASAMFASPHVLLLAGFVQYDLGQGPGMYGWLQAISGLGAIVSSLVVASMTEFDRKPLLQWIAGVLCACGLFVLAFGSMVAGLGGAIVAMVILGLTLTAYSTLNNAMVMDEARPEYYGRVMSINWVTFGMMPLMSYPLGIAADHIGAYTIFAIMGGIMLLIMVAVAVASPAYTFGRNSGARWREVDREASEAAEAASAAPAAAPSAPALPSS